MGGAESINTRKAEKHSNAVNAILIFDAPSKQRANDVAMASY